MSQPDVYELAGATAAAIADNANRLGLTWKLRMATTIARSVDGFTLAQYDADDTPINMVSMVGPLTAGARVYVIMVPPSGNFIVGFTNVPALSVEVYNNVDSGNPSSGTTTSGTYVDMPGPMQFFIFKLHEETELLLGMGGTWFESTGTAGTSASFGIEISGASSGDGDVSMSAYQATLPPGIVRLPIPTAERRAPCGSGFITLTARWLRNTGAGAIGVGAGTDFLYMKAQEIWV